MQKEIWWKSEHVPLSYANRSWNGVMGDCSTKSDADLDRREIFQQQ
jgi:hypothetical protein